MGGVEEVLRLLFLWFRSYTYQEDPLSAETVVLTRGVPFFMVSFVYLPRGRAFGGDGCVDKRCTAWQQGRDRLALCLLLADLCG